MKTEERIKEAIIEVVAFFDMFDYPLTGWEIWKYAKIRQNTPMVIYNILDSKKLNNIIEEKNGFYFLAGREKIIRTRMERYNYAGRKFKRAMLMAIIFKFIPWIKMIAIGNIIGAHNLKDNSDIDFFIITESGRIWITRFFCAGFMKLFGLRPKEGDKRDKICLSFFVSEEAMDLQSLMLGGKSSESPSGDFDGARNAFGRNYGAVGCSDIYFIYWLAGLMPIYNKDNIYEKFIKANSWIKKHLPNWQPIKLPHKCHISKGFSRFYHDIIDLLIGGLENNVKKLQIKLMPENLKRMMNQDNKVVINDQVLKLHVKDRREEYRKRWKKKVAEIGMEGYILK